MRVLLMSVVLLTLGSGCHHVNNPALTRDKTCKPPLNCLGNSYDGAYSGCYRPPGPFWCCMPGPCAACRDPWLAYYHELGCYKFTLRRVCNDTSVPGGLSYYGTADLCSPLRVASADDDELDDE